MIKNLFDDFLENDVFAAAKCETSYPDEDDSIGFEKYTKGFMNGIDIEKCAVEKF